MTRSFAIEVPDMTRKERLDRYLMRQIAHTSRSKIQRLIEGRFVLVNGGPVKSSHLIETGELIDVIIPAPEPMLAEPEDIPLDIRFEDDWLLVVNKPPGMVVHPALGHSSGTLVNALLHYCTRLSGVNGEYRPGIVHRLDKGTSGLLLVAKDDQTHRELAQQFSAHTVLKEYVALVWGVPKPAEGSISQPIGRSPTNRKKMSVIPDGRAATTHYALLESFGELSFIKLRPETGRTHQIRVHLASQGHPVFGDPTYGGRHRRLRLFPSGDRRRVAEILRLIDRPALHANALGFCHPATGEEMRLTLEELPEDMDRLMSVVRGDEYFGRWHEGKIHA